MLSHLSRFKPGVRRRTHLLLAATLWTCIGIFLIGRGMVWLYREDLLILIVPALVLGFLKSHCILDRTAIKSINRIMLLKDGTCMGAVYSKKTWLLVLAMMAMGALLRQTTLPGYLLGTVYFIVGWALLWSSRNGWKAWLRT